MAAPIRLPTRPPIAAPARPPAIRDPVLPPNCEPINAPPRAPTSVPVFSFGPVPVTGSAAHPASARLATTNAAPILSMNSPVPPRAVVTWLVRKQAELGIDVIDDGEFGKPSFVTYVRDRLAGLTRQEGERQSPWIRSREAISFPEFYQAQAAGAVNARQALMACTGPIKYQG